MSKIVREVAEQELQNYCDSIGMDSSDLDITLKDKKEVQDMIESDIIEEDQFQSELSKRDVIRESVVKALMKGILFINDNTDLCMKPRYIPVKENGEPLFDYLTLKKRVTYEQEKQHTKGINAEDNTAVVFAKVCARVGTPAKLLERLDSRDIDVLIGAEVFFRRAD